MSRYASQTTVSSNASRDEIERTLRRYGADQFVYGWREMSAVIGFRMKDRNIRFNLPMPAKADFRLTPGKQLVRSPEAIEKEWEQAGRQRWRALALVIKAKLEAVETGITEFESEFMAHIVLPGGETVGEWMRPQIASAYESGNMPPLLPGPSS
jgi:hypothetical protein